MKMIRIYQLNPDKAGWAKLNNIEAVRHARLPGICCPSCGVWAMTGLIYPLIEEKILNDRPFLKNPNPISTEEFDQLTLWIQPILGPTRPAAPGAELGILTGRGNGKFGHFAWVNPWTVLVRESVWIDLNKAGIKILGAPAKLEFESRQSDPFIELEALPKVKLQMPLIPKKCKICGRLSFEKPEKITIDYTSFDHAIPLARIVELPTIIIINELFAKFIQQNKLTDSILTPIEY